MVGVLFVSELTLHLIRVSADGTGDWYGFLPTASAIASATGKIGSSPFAVPAFNS